MGYKYIVRGFNYPFTYYQGMKQTKNIVTAIYWFIRYSIEFDGVDLEKRR